jgi:DNA-binding NtrC family response regulator
MLTTVILLVDDEKTILDSLRSQLRNLYGDSYEYETAETAAEAWEVLDDLLGEGMRVVVVVSDWLMPGQRGDEFLALLRERHPHIGRVMLTGHANAEALARAREEAHVYKILHKPWQPEDLRTAIEGALRTSDPVHS